MKAFSCSLASSHQSFRIGPVTRDRIGEAAQVMARVMTEVYPRFDQDQIRSKVQGLAETYLHPEDACLLAISDDRGRMIATAAVRAYDGRIREMRDFWSPAGMAELERVYVLQEWRRAGLGGLLVKAAEEFCESAGYSQICLHTHAFLPGASQLWSAQGYGTVFRGSDEWRTIFMEKTLSRAG